MIDPDQERLAAWLGCKSEALSVDAWDAVFPSSRGAELTRAEQMRMASMLRLAGWHSVVSWRDGKTRRVWIKGPDPKAKAPRVKREDALAALRADIMARLDRIDEALGISRDP